VGSVTMCNLFGKSFRVKTELAIFPYKLSCMIGITTMVDFI